MGGSTCTCHILVFGRKGIRRLTRFMALDPSESHTLDSHLDFMHFCMWQELCCQAGEHWCALVFQGFSITMRSKAPSPLFHYYLHVCTCTYECIFVEAKHPLLIHFSISIRTNTYWIEKKDTNSNSGKIRGTYGRFLHYMAVSLLNDPLAYSVEQEDSLEASKLPETNKTHDLQGPDVTIFLGGLSYV